MKRIWKIIIPAILLIAPAGCEDKINIALKNTEPQLVIEGVISDHRGESAFIISKTTDFFNPNVFQLVSGAQIIVTDSISFTDTVTESLTGYYFPYGFHGIERRTYTAIVTVDGKTYTASSHMPVPIQIDATRLVYQEGGGYGQNADDGYRLWVWYYDHAGTRDFCRLRVIANGLLVPDYDLLDDKYVDGEHISYEVDHLFSEGDSLMIDILSMDSTVFKYFLTLSRNVAWEDASEPQVAPANPNTNWTNGALGYFGAFSTSRWYRVVEP